MIPNATVVSADLQALIGDKAPTISVKINGERQTFSVARLDRVVARFGEDEGFLVVLGCERCKTTCVGSFGEHGAAYCNCCEPSGSVTAQHLWVARCADLISTFQLRGILPAGLFSQSVLERRLHLLSEDDFVHTIERNAELREVPLTITPINEPMPSLRLVERSVAA